MLRPDLDLDIQSLLGTDESILPRRPNNIKQNSYDGTMFNDLLKASRELRRLTYGDDGGTIPKFDPWPAMMQDVWAAFYKALPELTPDDEVRTEHKFNRPFIEKLLEDAETQKTRITTTLDELLAGLAALAAGKALREEIESREDLKEAMRKASDAGFLGDENAQADNPMKDHAKQQAEQMAREVEQTLQQSAREIRRAIKQAVRAGQEEAQEAQGVMAGWGLEPGDLQSIPMDQRLELLRKFQKGRVKKLAALVGRMRNLARARQRQMVRQRQEEIHSVEVGGDLQRVLPSELGAIRHPIRRLDFYRKLTERSLLQYQLTAREKLGRGPLIALIDISGSMRGEPLDWAVATALALVDTASRQNRQAAAIFFDTEIKVEFEFAPGEHNPQKLAAMASIDASGGTDYEPALRRAGEMIDRSSYKKADVVMVTDGICRMSEGFTQSLLAGKKRLDHRIWTVLVGSEKDRTGYLKTWSDEVWDVRMLTDEVAGDIFERVY